MNVNLDSILPRGKQLRRLLNAAFGALSAAFFVWLVALWASPMPSPGDFKPSDEAGSERRADALDGAGASRAAAYAAIVEKDLFRQDRRKYVPPPPPPPPPPKPAYVAPPPPPPPPPKPPKLTLVGTVIQDDGSGAIIDYGTRKSSYFKIGESIEGFAITEIGQDFIVLKKGEVTQRYEIHQGTSSGPSGAQPHQIAPLSAPASAPPGGAPAAGTEQAPAPPQVLPGGFVVPRLPPPPPQRPAPLD